MTFAERVDPNGAYVFTLPPSWTAHEAITLRAVVNPSDVYGAVPECTGCQDNNTFIVSEVRFVPRSPITISPVEVIWTHSSGTVIRPSAPSAVFARTAAANTVVVYPGRRRFTADRIAGARV